MGSFSEVAPGVLERQEGGGAVAVLGLPFLGAGIFVTLVGTQILKVQNAAEVPWWAWPLLVLMGLAFIGAGIVLVLGRKWVRFDRGRNLVLRQWGLLRPTRSEEFSLRDFVEVRLSQRSGDSDSPDCFPVMLRAGPAAKDFEVLSSTDYGGARDAATRLGSFLKLPVTDTTTAHAETVAASPGEPAPRSRLNAGGEEQAFPPMSMRSRVEQARDSIQIVIPGPGFKLGMLLELAIPLGLILYFGPGLLQFFKRTNTPEPIQQAFLGFLLFLFGFLPLLGFAHSLAKAFRGHTRIVASPEGLVLETRGAIFTRRKRIPRSEILGLDYGTAAGVLEQARAEAAERARQSRRNPGEPGGSADRNALPAWVEKLARFARSKGVTVKSKSGLATFAAGLPDEEVRYLFAVVKGALGAGTKPGSE